MSTHTHGTVALDHMVTPDGPGRTRSAGRTRGRRAARIRAALAELRRLVEDLPLPPADGCFARNWLASAAELIEAGDLRAAGYQIRLVVRKLKVFP
jgi:hypothetical protein